MRALRWRLHQRVTRRSRLRESERWHHDHTDARDNSAATPPPEERISWPGFWLAELYAPSHAQRLATGLDRLDDVGGTMFRREVPSSEWIASQRASTGAWLNVGFFAQPDRFAGVQKPAGLPRQLRFASLRLYQIAPGITVLVALFALEEDGRRLLDDVLRQNFSSRAFPIKGGHTVEGPEQQKEQAIGRVRDRYRTLAWTWLCGYVPGLFASRDTPTPPAWDLVLTKEELLFSDEPTKDGRWRDVLGFGGLQVLRWESPRLPGVHFLEHPYGDRSRPAPTFTAIEADALRVLETEPGRGDDVDSLLQLLEGPVTDLLALSTIHAALLAHRGWFSQARDHLMEPSRSGEGRRLSRLRKEVLPLAFDLGALEQTAKDTDALRLPGRFSDAEFVPSPLPERINWKSSDEPLLESIATRIAEIGPVVASQGKEIANALRIQAELFLAHTNVRLQWAVLTVTIVAVGISAVAIILSVS